MNFFIRISYYFRIKTLLHGERNEKKKNNNNNNNNKQTNKQTNKTKQKDIELILHCKYAYNFPHLQQGL